MDVDGRNTNSHTVTGLTNGQTYTISIVGTSSSVGLPREPVSAGTVDLGNLTNVSYIMFFTCIQKLCMHGSINFPFVAVMHIIAVCFMCISNVMLLLNPQFHQLQYSMRLQQSLLLPSPSLAVFPVAQ